MIGKFLVDLKEYQHSSEISFQRMDTELQNKLTRTESEVQIEDKIKKMREKLNEILTKNEQTRQQAEERLDK